jgi:hypothetical protein
VQTIMSLVQIPSESILFPSDLEQVTCPQISSLHPGVLQVQVLPAMDQNTGGLILLDSARCLLGPGLMNWPGSGILYPLALVDY